MFKKYLHIMAIILFALSAMGSTVQAKPICDNQMSMSSDVPCNMPCHDKNNQSNDDKCCGDSATCSSVAAQAMLSSSDANSLYTKGTKYNSLANQSLESLYPEAPQSPPKHLS